MSAGVNPKQNIPGWNDYPDDQTKQTMLARNEEHRRILSSMDRTNTYIAIAITITALAVALIFLKQYKVI